VAHTNTPMNIQSTTQKNFTPAICKYSL